MKAKGVWGWAIAGVLGLGALIGPPLADSLVKEGKLPDWISGKLTGMSEFLSQQVPFPLWLIILGVLLACALTVEFYKGAVKTADCEGHIARLKALCDEREQRSLQLEESRSSLLVQLVEKTQALEAMESLEPKVAPLTVEQNKVIAAIAAFDNADKRCSTNGLPAWTELTLLQTDGALDVLAKRKLIQVLYPSTGRYATLTAEGRAYVLHPNFNPPLLLHLPHLVPEPYRDGRI